MTATGKDLCNVCVKMGIAADPEYQPPRNGGKKK